MADTPDIAVLTAQLSDLNFEVENLKKSLLSSGIAVDKVTQGHRALSDIYSGLNEKQEKAVRFSMEFAEKTFNAGRSMEVFNRRAQDLGLSFGESSQASRRLAQGLQNLTSEMDINKTGMGELIERMKGGTIGYSDLGKQMLNTFGTFKYGWYSAALELAKGVQHIDIQTRRATIGLMGIGQGRVGGIGGLGIREYQATEDLRRSTGQSIANLVLMGKSSKEAADSIMSMTQVFGSNFAGMGATVGMAAAELSTAFALATNTSEEVARSATINLTQRFGMSAQTAGATLYRFDSAARAIGMSTNLYAGWVTELSQATRTYTTDIGFAQAMVRRFGKELQAGQITVQQLAQMGTGLRQADFGRQAGILALSQQLGVRVSGVPSGMSPLASIGFVGEANKQTKLLELQVKSMQALTQQIAPRGQATDLERMGAMRLIAQEFPALKNLQNLSNKELQDIFDGVADLGKLQEKIDKEAPSDPGKQMEMLIDHAKNISLSTKTVGDALKDVTVASAFRVSVVRFGPDMAARTEEFNRRQKQAQEQERKEVQQLTNQAKFGTDEDREEASRKLMERRMGMGMDRIRREREAKQLEEHGRLSPEEARQRQMMMERARKGDPTAEKFFQDERTKKALPGMFMDAILPAFGIITRRRQEEERKAVPPGGMTSRRQEEEERKAIPRGVITRRRQDEERKDMPRGGITRLRQEEDERKSIPLGGIARRRQEEEKKAGPPPPPPPASTLTTILAMGARAMIPGAAAIPAPAPIGRPTAGGTTAAPTRSATGEGGKDINVNVQVGMLQEVETWGQKVKDELIKAVKLSLALSRI